MQTQVVPYLREIGKTAEESRDRGAEEIAVSLLTFEPAVDEIDIARQRRALAERRINWSYLPYHKRPSVLATAWDVFRGALFIRRRIGQFDILHARSHVPMLMAALARKFSRQKPKILFDIRGFMPEEYTDAGIWPENGRLYRTAKRVERWLIKEADAYVVLTEKARKILVENSEVRSQNSEVKAIEVIPCCVGLERFREANDETRARMREELGIGQRKVLVYVGAFGGWYLTDEMIELFRAFKQDEPDAFAMILTQSDPAAVEFRLKQSGYGEGDLLIKKVPAADVPRYLCAANIAVSFIKPCYSKLASSPTKNAEYLSCGLPIIANTGIGDVDELIEGNQVGVLVRTFDDEAYRRALEDIGRLGEVADRCREVARREFGLESVGGVRYRRLYGTLLGRTALEGDPKQEYPKSHAP